MKVQSAVQQQLGFWHSTLDQVLGDCSPEVLNKNLPGATITSIASIYTHLVFAEDVIVHGMLQGKPPLYQAQGWAGKLGIEMRIPPEMDPDWAKTVKLDPAAFQEYARAVYAATDSYLAGLTDGDLERKVSTPAGEQSVAWCLATILGTHFPQHVGEVAALKGVQGLKGLPF